MWVKKKAGSATSKAIANQQGGGSTPEHTHGFRGSLKILFCNMQLAKTSLWCKTIAPKMTSLKS